MNEEKFIGKCEGCGKSGHKKADCWQEEANKGKRPKWWKDQAKTVVTVGASVGESTSKMWVVREIGE